MHHRWIEIIDIACKTTKGNPQRTNSFELKNNSNNWPFKDHRRLRIPMKLG
jgi:hypothetical protein